MTVPEAYGRAALLPGGIECTLAVRAGSTLDHARAGAATLDARDFLAGLGEQGLSAWNVGDRVFVDTSE